MNLLTRILSKILPVPCSTIIPRRCSGLVLAIDFLGLDCFDRCCGLVLLGDLGGDLSLCDISSVSLLPRNLKKK